MGNVKLYAVMTCVPSLDKNAVSANPATMFAEIPKMTGVVSLSRPGPTSPWTKRGAEDSDLFIG